MDKRTRTIHDQSDPSNSGTKHLASHIALEEAGADYELVKINLGAGEQRTPEFLAINPAGSTPALVTDEGVLTENVVIMGYIAETHRDARLADDVSSFSFSKMQSMNAWLGSSLHPAMGKLLFSRPALEGEARDAAAKVVLDKLDVLENHLFLGPWARGENYTVADGYVSVFTRWARQAGLLDPARYANLADHLDRIQSRPAVRKVLAAEGIEAV